MTPLPDAQLLITSAESLERLASRTRSEGHPGWLDQALELEEIARSHRARAAELNAAEVPDVLVFLACPKCGGRDVHTKYESAQAGCGASCHPRHPDRFTHHCRRCSYDWQTHEFADEQ